MSQPALFTSTGYILHTGVTFAHLSWGLRYRVFGKIPKQKPLICRKACILSGKNFHCVCCVVQLTLRTVYFNLTWKQTSQKEDRILWDFKITLGHGSWKSEAPRLFCSCSTLKFPVLVYTLNVHKAAWRAPTMQNTCKGTRGLGTVPLSTVPPVGQWPLRMHALPSTFLSSKCLA